MKESFLKLTAFLAGMIILVLEVLAFRMFAPFFGTTIYVSGTLIGTVLAALAAGSYFGGWMADKHPSYRGVYELILAASILTFFVGYFHSYLLLWFSEIGLVSGTLLATIVLLAPPMVLLACVSPFIENFE